MTETIWQSTNWRNTLLAGEKWPEPKECSEIAAAQFGRLKRLVVEARYVIAELPGNETYPMLYMDDSLVADNKDLIMKLAKLKAIEHVDQPRGLRLAASGRDAWLDVDADTLYEHQSNLEVRLAQVRSDVQMLEGRLANESYIAKAPAELVQESRQQLAAKQTLLERLQAELSVIGHDMTL